MNELIERVQRIINEIKDVPFAARLIIDTVTATIERPRSEKRTNSARNAANVRWNHADASCERIHADASMRKATPSNRSSSDLNPDPDPDKLISAEIPPEDAIVTFPTVGNGPSKWHLTQSRIDELRDVYPGVDVVQEAKKARNWCQDNPRKRKTHRGMPGFLSNWLSRAQNTPAKISRPISNSGKPNAPREFVEGDYDLDGNKRQWIKKSDRTNAVTWEQFKAACPEEAGLWDSCIANQNAPGSTIANSGPVAPSLTKTHNSVEPIANGAHPGNEASPADDVF